MLEPATDPRISVIVPVFNAEEYVRVCVGSILEQTLDGIELILVDDGSSDSSGSIVDELSSDYPQIQAIHQANAGPGPARNAGLRLAKGEYVAFFDADDWVEPQMLEILYDLAKRSGAQMAACRMKVVRHGTLSAITFTHPGVFGPGDVEVDEIVRKLYGMIPGDSPMPDVEAASTSIYERKLLLDKGVLFRDCISEDILFKLEVLHVAEKVAYCDDPLYNIRRDGQDSVTRTISSAKLARTENFFSILEGFAASETPNRIRECKERIVYRALSYGYGLLWNIEDSKADEPAKRELSSRTLDARFFKQALQGPQYRRFPFRERLILALAKLGHAGLIRFLMRTWRRLRSSNV